MPETTTTLEPGDAWTKLRSTSYGRLAVCHDGQPDVFPVNFLATDSGILIRTREGTKVERITANDHVAFEADGVTSDRVWSVVVKGLASRLEESAVGAARNAPLWAWAPGPTEVFIRIRATEITGRMFNRHH